MWYAGSFLTTSDSTALGRKPMKRLTTATLPLALFTGFSSGKASAKVFVTVLARDLY